SADSRINSTIAIFQLTRSNVANLIPGQFTYQATGKQRSRGFEFDGQFKLTPDWEMVASYSYIDAVVTEDTSIPVDSWVPSTPKNKVSLWTRYVIPSGLFKGLGFSAGGSIYTRQAGDDNNTYFVSGYGLLNLNVSYRRARYELLLNVNNA